MIKCKAWKGNDLQGTWTVHRKLDGVRALVRELALGRGLAVVSRHGKPLHNLTEHAARFTDAEVWLGSWELTVSAVRRSARPVRVPRTAIYPLDPPDRRLFLGQFTDPTARLVRTLLQRHKRPGEDGLVLRQGATWLKVKHVATYDVQVTGVQPGTGKHRGRLGALLTTMGKVGTGFNDKMREALWRSRNPATRQPDVIGQTIEVACNELTPGGRFKHARFVRVREDR